MSLLNAQQKRTLTALVASRPGIRTVEISDLMDSDIEPVQLALQDLVADGVLSVHDVKAPNGRAAKGYTPFGDPLPAVPGAVVVADAVASAKPLTKVEQAIDFIAANGGQATSAELHALLGLKPAEYASSYLSGGISDGRLVKDGKTWTLGSGVRVAPVSAPAPRPDQPVVATPATPDVPTFVPAAPTAALVVSDAAPMAVSAPAVPLADPAVPAANQKMSYAIWSDGALHVARDGVTVLALSPDDARDFLAYVNKPAAEVA